jgi:hypothetical protein
VAVIKKCLLIVGQAVLFSACELFELSIGEYLREIPPELRLKALQVEYDGNFFYPLEEVTPDRDVYTIVVTPGSATAGITLRAEPEDPASHVSSFQWPSLPPRSAQTISTPEIHASFSPKSFPSYRPDETKLLTITAAGGPSLSYAVTIVWAKLIRHPSEINEATQDYYLKPDAPIVLEYWGPLYPSTGSSFKGSLRGNGAVITLTSFSSMLVFRGLFGCLENAVIEDLHMRLDGLSTGTEHVGGIAGQAKNSLIQRVRVSGSLSNTVTGTPTETDTGGIAGTLDSGAMIRNCVSTADVSGSSANTYSNFYMGALAGNEVYTSGGFIINSYATGRVRASSPATIGGITGGGGYSFNHGTPDSEIKGCIALNAELDAGGGRGSPILGQWDGPTTPAINGYNYARQGLSVSNTLFTAPSGQFIDGTPVTDGALHEQATYENLGWDFVSVWKMAGGLPALKWE